jgi:hypothetical protein
MGLKLRLPGAIRNLIRWPVAQLAGKDAGDKAVEAVEEAVEEAVVDAATQAITSEAERELLRRFPRTGKDQIR